MITLKTISFQS